MPKLRRWNQWARRRQEVRNPRSGNSWRILEIVGLQLAVAISIMLGQPGVATGSQSWNSSAGNKQPDFSASVVWIYEGPHNSEVAPAGAPEPLAHRLAG
jgi:hypothetical protein